MEVPWNELIQRARVYCGDDHADEDSWITPERWMNIFSVEYSRLYRRWVRAGLLTPAATQTTLTSHTMALDGVLAVVGVAQDMGGSMRILEPLQPAFGLDTWRSSTEPNGIAMGWTAHGFGNEVTVELRPHDAAYSQYRVRFIPAPEAATDPEDDVILPDGGDERLVLGAARRAGIKDYANSHVVAELIADADAELNMQAWGALNGPRVRVVPQRRPHRTWSTDPRVWFFTPGLSG